MIVDISLSFKGWEKALTYQDMDVSILLEISH